MTTVSSSQPESVKRVTLTVDQCGRRLPELVAKLERWAERSEERERLR